MKYNKYNIEKMEEAFERFLEYDFEQAVIQSTEEEWANHNNCVLLEIFNDGSYRLLLSRTTGNHYCSPGLIMKVPGLGEDEWDDDPSMCYFEPTLLWIKEMFEAKIAELKEEVEMDL